MERNVSYAPPKKTVLLAVVVAVTLFSICLSFILILHYSMQQREVLKVTDQYMAFEGKVERLIYANITMLQGYSAYIKSNPDLDQDSAYEYLDHLLAENMKYIRNVGVIQDTTIIWNYPRGSSAMTIGVDLSKVAEQRDLVLKVKTEMTTVFQGPVNLVQGGTGFIVRLPIVMEGTGYWGQISIVLKTDAILKEISAYAESARLHIALFNEKSDTVPFWGTVSSKGNETLIFDVDPTFMNWKAQVDLPNVWFDNLSLFLQLIVLSFGVSAFAGLFFYEYLKSNDKLRKMSTHDFLTGLYNRHFLDEYQPIVLSAAKREKRNVAIMLLDLNQFKKINDTYGHGVGDLVLIETARILKENTRTCEAVFRLGGDEFLLILPEIENRERLKILIERLRKCFDEEFCISGHPIKAAFSIGCALFPEDGEDIDTLLQKADANMYLEKSKGLGRR